MALDYQWFEEMESRIPHGQVRTRFAPSPTGYMHVGNLRTALYTYLIARHAGGRFILRIEDTDQKRKVEDAVAVIKRTLAACGLDGDFYAHRERPRSEVFPWCRIDPMVTPAFLWHERELCYQSQTTPDCRTRCSGCGANRLLKGGVCNG